MNQKDREAYKKRLLNGQESGVPQIKNNMEEAFKSHLGAQTSDLQHANF